MKRLFHAAFVSAFSILANAQGLGTFVGTVTDPSGAVIPAAQVTLTERASALTRTATANNDGYFVVSSLKPSVYNLAVAAAGFTTYEQTGITLLASQSLTVNVSLKVGSTGEKVTVEANAVQVNTSTGALSQVIDSDRMIELPLQGRNAAQLTALVAGAIPTQIVGVVSQGAFGGRTGGGASFSVSGSRQNGTFYQLDGATFMEETTNTNMTFPFPDALQEFSVQTNSFSAQSGGSAGANVNVMTKSGTNEFHGNAFNFVRNEVFNARNFFGVARDKVKRNQPGGTLGGPIWRNRTFFFAGYQGTLIRVISGAGRQIIPTPANVRGDFSAMLNANDPANPLRRATVVNDPISRQPFPGNIIPVSRLDPASLALTKFLPVDKAQADGTILFAVPGQNEDFNEVISRVDHSLSDKDRLMVRFNYNLWDKPAIYDPTNIMIYTNSNTGGTGGAALRHSRTISPNLLNDAQFSYSRVITRRGVVQDAVDYPKLGVNVFAEGNLGLQFTGVDGMFSIGIGPPFSQARNHFLWTNNMSWIRGRHNISFGGSAERVQFNFWAQGGVSGGFNPLVTNSSMASFMLGRLGRFGQANPNVSPVRTTHMTLYFQDDFKVNRRLTLNLGLRWEPYMPLTDFYGRANQFRLEDYQAGRRSQVFPNAPIGLMFHGDPGVPRSGITGDYNNFAPRFGFAYDLFGNGKTSIRGGAGQFYNSRPMFDINYASYQPFTFSANQANLDVQNVYFSNPWAGFPGGNPFPRPIVPGKDAAFTSPYNFTQPSDPAKKHITASTYNWNLTIERQLVADALLRVGYVGSRSTHMMENLLFNPAVYIPGSTLSIQQRRRFPEYDNFRTGSPGLTASYHSLQVTLEKRLSRGFTILSNYTWSKTLDTTPSQSIVPSTGTWSSTLPWDTPGRHKFEYGRPGMDRTHRFVTSYVWRLPRMATASRPLRELLGGWDFTGIWTLQTGGPLTVMAGVERSFTGIGADRADIIGPAFGPGACGSAAPCVDSFNRSSFRLPAIGTFGNIGKGAINSGPGIFNLDFGLFKNISITEKVRIQLRGEFFNATNRTNFNDPQLSMTAGTFGQIRNAADPRIVQMAVKVIF